MKRFRFSLQALHTLRQQQEQQALEQYAQALQALENARRQREAAQGELEAGWRLGQQQLAAGTSVSHWSHTREYCRAVEERLRAIDRQLENVRKRVKQCWDHWLHARQQREVVDQYHQRQRRRYDQSARRAEQKTLDDLAHQTVTEATLSKINFNQ